MCFISQNIQNVRIIANFSQKNVSKLAVSKNRLSPEQNWLLPESMTVFFFRTNSSNKYVQTFFSGYFHKNYWTKFKTEKRNRKISDIFFEQNFPKNAEKCPKMFFSIFQKKLDRLHIQDIFGLKLRLNTFPERLIHNRNRVWKIKVGSFVASFRWKFGWMDWFFRILYLKKMEFTLHFPRTASCENVQNTWKCLCNFTSH